MIASTYVYLMNLVIELQLLKGDSVKIVMGVFVLIILACSVALFVKQYRKHHRLVLQRREAKRQAQAVGSPLALGAGLLM